MSETWMPGSKVELMSAIEREWTLLLDVAGKLSDQQMSTPDEGGWSPKDNLAHLAEWIGILMGYHMDQRPSHEVIGVSQELLKDWDFELVNRILFEKNRSKSRQAVMDELHLAYKQVTARLNSMSLEELMKPRRADDPEKRPILLWVLGDTSEHFAEHRETIEKILKA